MTTISRRFRCANKERSAWKRGARRSRHGLVLLLVLGVLALMSVMAVSLLSMARLERSVSRNYVDHQRAQLAAESGVERAISALNEIAGVPTFSQSDWMTFGLGEAPDVSLLDAKHPSFVVDLNGDGNLDDGISGVVSSEYAPNSEYYKLKVEDESGKFNVNDSPGIPAPPRIRRIVQYLAANLFSDDDRMPSLAGDVSVVLFQVRDAEGGHLSTLDGVKAALTEASSPSEDPLLSLSQWEQLRRNITTDTWTDPNTLKPNPPVLPHFSETVPTIPGPPADDNFVYDMPAGETAFTKWIGKFDHEVYTMDQIQPVGLELEPRSPVNINAASQELIAALLEGIQGYYIYEYGHQFVRGGPGTSPNPLVLNHNLYNAKQDGPPPVTHDNYGTDVAQLMLFGGGEYQVRPWSTKTYRPILYNSRFQHAYEYNVLNEVPTLPFAQLAGNGLGAYKRSVRVDRVSGGGDGIVGGDNLVDHLAAAIYQRIHGGPNGVDLNGDGDTDDPDENGFNLSRYDISAQTYPPASNGGPATDDDNGVSYAGNDTDFDDPFESRNPFRTWQEFQCFIYEYFGYNDPQARVPVENGDLSRPPYVSNFARQSVADAILANFNPNSDLNSYNPGRVMYKLVDKAHLLNDDANIGYSTEFSFQPTSVYSIQSLGVVSDAGGEILAQAELETRVMVFLPYRMTSQAQFLGADSAQPMNDGHDLKRFFSVNESAPPTYGPLSTAGAGTGCFGPPGSPEDTMGFTVESYPEPVVQRGNAYSEAKRVALVGGRLPGSGYIPGAVYDGYLMPATYQPMVGTVGSTTTPPLFRASFNGTHDADVSMADRGISGGGSALYETKADTDIAGLGPYGTPALIPEQPTADRLMIGKEYLEFLESEGVQEGTIRSGSLYVDGGYSEAHRSLIYPSGEWATDTDADGPFTLYGQPRIAQRDGNFGSNWGQQGTLLMWVKPNWHPERTGKPHILFDMSCSNRWPFRLYSEALISGDPFVQDFWWQRSSDGKHLFNKNRVDGNVDAVDNSVFRLMFHPARNPNNSAQVNGKPDQMEFKVDAQFAWTEDVVAPFNSIMRRFTNVDDIVNGFENGSGLRVYDLNRQTLLDAESEGTNYTSANDFRSQFLGHRWSQVALKWDVRAKLSWLRVNDEYAGRLGTATTNPDAFGAEYRCNLWRNFDPVTSADAPADGFSVANPFTGGLTVATTGTIESDYFVSPSQDPYKNSMRFGAWARGNSNFVADATYDEVRIYSEGALNGGKLYQPFNMGRYYNNPELPATYISPEIEPHRLLRVHGSKVLRLHSIAWTVYWPNDVVDALPSGDIVPGNLPDPLWEKPTSWYHGQSTTFGRTAANSSFLLDSPGAQREQSTWDPVTMDVCRPDGTWLYSNSDMDIRTGGWISGNPNGGLPLPTLAQAFGSKVIDPVQDASPAIRRGESVRFKAYFNYYQYYLVSTNPSHLLGYSEMDRVHEAPVLNDVTLFFTFQSPQILSWKWVR